MPSASGIYFSEQGAEKPGQPAVVLVHGAGTSHQVWPMEIRHLPGWHVLALDLPGHGQSAGSGSQSIQDYAARLLDFADALDIYQAVYVGHCMGGAAVLAFTRQHPERVAAMGIVAAAARLVVPRRLLELLSVPEGLPTAADFFLELSLEPGLPRSLSGKLHRMLSGTRRGVLHDDILACGGFSFSLARANLARPALLLAGAEDRFVPLADIRHLARHIPDCSLQIFESTGHLPMLAEPARAAKALTGFLQEKLPD